ncbi:MAG: glycosyltransferase [Bacteroidota bacterium]
MRIAVVHDWFSYVGGAEKVVAEIISTFQKHYIEVFCLVDLLEGNDRTRIYQGRKVNTSFIQKLPFSRKKYRSYLPFYPFAIEQFDLSGFDLIISSSSSVAKGILTHPYQKHICYCHTPMRYAWDLYQSYLKKEKLEHGLKSFFVKMVLHYLRVWDLSTNNRVDLFLANSKYVAERIHRLYKRSAKVVYPPIKVINVEKYSGKRDYYLVVSRMVPYKRIDLILEAFHENPSRQLVVIGTGPELKQLKLIKGSNIEFKGHIDSKEVYDYMKRAKAVIFAAEEDFGMTAVEAQACGTPVIAYAKGGHRESIIENKTGILYTSQTKESIQQAIEQFENSFPEMSIQEFDHLELFSEEKFRNKLTDIVNEQTSAT